MARDAAAGSREAFDALARRHQVAVIRFVRRRFPNVDADDVVQETFVSAYRNAARYDGRVPWRVWLLTIAHRRAIDAARRPRLAVTSAEVVDERGPDADDVEAGRGLWALARRLLTGEQYAALWLFYAKDLPPRQIARVLGRSWPAVKTMLFRARRTLRQHAREEP